MYLSTEPNTIPCNVTKNTTLHSLNLNWGEKELPEKERTKHVHRLHPYLGKFIPQLVEIFLRKYFIAGQTVIDPFCGSGTTLVQANELGINSIGYDVSAFNILLSRAKTTKYDLLKVRKEIMDIFNKICTITQREPQQLCLLETSFTNNVLSPKTEDSYLNQWFAPQALSELLTYLQLIENEDYEYQNLLKIILSRSARSARLTTHFDLDFPKKPQNEPYWCYKHSRVCQPTGGALKFLKRYSLDTIKRIEEFSHIRTNAITISCHADSRNTPPPLIHGAITSPPYVGLIDYHEQHAYAYHLLGLEDKRTWEIGPAVNGVSKKAQKQYQEDIAAVFQNVMGSMQAGSPLIVIAGDKANLYSGIADILGVEVEAVIQRHVNRRTGRRSGQFYESVFIWRKR